MPAPQIVGPAFFPTANDPAFNGIQTSQRWFAFASNTNYILQILAGTGGGSINGTGVYASTDGTTYTEQDAGNRPNNALGAVFQDTVNNRWIGAFVQDTFPQTQKNIFLKNFNFATNTWGANYAAGGPLAQTTIVDVFLRPDGTIFVIFDLGAGHAPGGQTRLQAAFWNGAAWSANLDVGAASLPAQNIVGTSCSCAMEPVSGDIHIAYTNGVNYFYQQIKANNTLGDSHAFGALGLGNNDWGNLIVFNNSVYITGVDGTFTDNELFIGTPLGAANWTTIIPANMTKPGGLVNTQGMIQQQAGTLFWETSFFSNAVTYVAFQIFTSQDNGQTWTIAPGNDTEPYFYDFEPGGSPQAPNTDATFGMAQPLFFLPSTSQFGVTAYVLGGVRNTAAGAFVNYVVNAQIFQISLPVVVSVGPGQPKSYRIVHMPKICCKRKLCWPIDANKETYVSRHQ